MNRYWITYAKGADLEQQSVFAVDAASAIDSFLKKNPEVKSTNIVSVATKGLQSGEDKNIHGGNQVDDQQTRLQPKTGPDPDQPEPSNILEDARSDANGTEVPREEVWSGTSTGGADQRSAFGVTAMFITILLVAVGIWTISILNENPDSEPSSLANQETANSQEDSYESEWDSYPVDFRSLREDAQNNDGHIIQGTNFAIANRIGHRNYVQEKKDGTRWALVSSLSNSLAMASWTVHCDEKRLQVEYALGEGPEEWKKPKIGTQGFAVAATICKIPSTPSY